MYIYFNVNNASNNSTQLHILTLYDPWSTFNVGCEESGETHCTVVNYAAKSNVLMEKKTLRRTTSYTYEYEVLVRSLFVLLLKKDLVYKSKLCKRKTSALWPLALNASVSTRTKGQRNIPGIGHALFFFFYLLFFFLSFILFPLHF